MSRSWLLWLAVLSGAPLGCTTPPIVRIGSKADIEGGLLGEIAVQLARSTGARAEYRRLGGTQIVWQALKNGEIDAYPEYTGTLTEEILASQKPASDEALRQALVEQGIIMSKPLGFNNTYALGMQEEVAARLGIRTISDLRQHPELKFGFSNEFMGRKDCWPKLKDRYQLPQRDVSGLDHSLSYRALIAGKIDVIDLYSTDAKIRKFRLRVLRDDLGNFPAYQAVFLYRAELEERWPHTVQALRQLEGRISEEDMVSLNARVEEDKEPASAVAADFLARTLDIHTEARTQRAWEELWQHTQEHIFLVFVSLAGAILLAVPLGIVSARLPGVGHVVLGAVGIVQTIPSLALLVFMIPLLGTGGLPAIAALFLYSLLPIVRNTYAGLHDIPGNLKESAEALGLPPLARLRLVELPLASRTIMAGIKTAAVINVGTATVGALIGAGGYGQAIITGIQLNDVPLIIWQGAIPAAVLALLVQGLFELAERALVPRGLRLARAR